MAISRLFVVILMLCTTMCFASITIDSVIPELSTSSNTGITIVGSSFETVTVTDIKISGRVCTDVQVISDNQILCEAKPGLGQGNPIVITYLENSVEQTATANVVNYEPAHSVRSCSNNITEILISYGQDIEIAICGVNFGDPDETTNLNNWEGKLEVILAGGFKAEIISHTDDMIIAKLPNVGAGQKLSVKVVLGTQTVAANDIFVSFPQPTVDGIRVDNSVKRAALVRVIITGRNFGIPANNVHVSATVGGFPCINLKHVSDSEIRCSVSGHGANTLVVVTVNGQASATPGDSTTGAPAVRFDFPDARVEGLDCIPPYGAADVINPEYCNCWAGAAPFDTLLSQDCSVHSVCAGKVSTQPDVSQFPPTRPQTEFKDDKLWIKQSMPVVKNRRDTIIQFVVPSLNVAEPATPAGTIGASTCFYPGNLWVKKINNLDCVDEYYGVLPWVQHELCGFVEHKAPAIVASPLRVWKSNLVTSFTETYRGDNGVIVFRKIQHSFLVSVSFTRQIVVLTHTPVSAYITDEQAAYAMDLVILGDALYDVSSKSTIIQIETTLAWPYQLADLAFVGNWKRSVDNTAAGVVDAQLTLNPIQGGEVKCDQVQDTTCEQSLILTINTHPGSDPQVCNLKGVLEFSTGALLCRDYTSVGACSGAPSTNFTVRVGKTDLCDTAPHVDASAGLTPTLITFFDEALSVPQSVFQTGDMVFFKLTVVNPTSTIDQITLKEIVVRSSVDSSVSDNLYFLTVSGDVPEHATIFKADAEFNITKEVRQPYIAPGDEGVLSFHFRLRRDKLNVVTTLSASTPSDITKTLTVEATIDILYHGNTAKRTFVATTNIPAMADAQISFYDVEDNQGDDALLLPHNNEENNFGEDVLGAAPSTVASIAVVAGVALFALL